jgi:hypothetical protein
MWCEEVGSLAIVFLDSINDRTNHLIPWDLTLRLYLVGLSCLSTPEVLEMQSKGQDKCNG